MGFIESVGGISHSQNWRETGYSLVGGMIIAGLGSESYSMPLGIIYFKP